MEFSYIVDKKPLLKNINLNFSQNRLTVITGVENVAFEILGGVISGLFPIEKEESFPQLEEMIKYFSGELIIHSGSMPESGLYIGADPDKHILFSKVKEEIYAQLGFNINSAEVINRFGLDETFLNRKIMTLSGGEKVKIALSILFSKKADCIVLHGVLPWLDINGKNIIMKEIERSLDKGIKVIILEQEIDNFQDLNTEFYYFDGETINMSNKNDILKKKGTLLRIIGDIKNNINSKNTSNKVLQFKNVYFDYSLKLSDNLLLEDMNFTLFASHIYGLTGENGSGKSTIARLITRILSPIKGNITFEEMELRKINRKDIINRVSYVGQFPERQLVYGDVDQYKEKSKSNNNELSLELLNEFFSSANSYPISTLSPLQLKLLLLFSSITKNSRLIILDEPTWGVDIDGQMKIAEVIDFLIGKVNGLTMFLISHDRGFLNEFSTSQLMLSHGKIKIEK